MVCAQALALIARVMKRCQAGEAVDILYNTEDVRRDAAAWATEQGHRVIEETGSTLRIERRRAW
jgi:TusA-related sulfurtransferase